MFAVTYVQFLENITGRRPAGAVVQDHRDYQGFINLDQFIQANPVSLQPNVFEAIECNISFNTPLLDVVLAAHVRSEKFSLSRLHGSLSTSSASFVARWKSTYSVLEQLMFRFHCLRTFEATAWIK